MSAPRLPSGKGITLIELMAVISVIAILAGLAYPSYRQYLVRSNRSEMQQFMLDVANREEEYLLNNRQYTSALGDLNLSLPARLQKNYAAVTITRTDLPPTYTITATPRSGTLQADDGNLSYGSDGTRTPLEKW